MTDDEDWTSSPKRYTGMNAGPSYDSVKDNFFEDDEDPGDIEAIFESHVKQVTRDYRTLDSGERQEFSSGMKRDTSTGKIEWALIVPEVNYGKPMVQRWAELMTRGAQKYEKRNWELAESDDEYQRFRESAFRHFFQWYLGETDEDHAAAVFFNIQGAEYVKDKIAEFFDRGDV